MNSYNTRMEDIRLEAIKASIATITAVNPIIAAAITSASTINSEEAIDENKVITIAAAYENYIIYGKKEP